MNPSDKIHWQVVDIRRRSTYYSRGCKNSYAVNLRGLFFPGEVIYMAVNILALRPKKIRNYFFPVRSREEIERLNEL
jgi:hypothetical protein